MVAAAMKHMASNVSKLDKFEGVDFKRWQKKMYFLLSNMSVVYVLTTLILKNGSDDATVEQISRKRAKWDNDDYVCRGLILNAHLEHKKEELTLVELGSHLRIEESLRVQDSDKPKGNNVVGPSVVNMVEHNNSSRYNDNKGKRKHHDNIRDDLNKKAKPTCWKCGKTAHIKGSSKVLMLVTKPMVHGQRVQWMMYNGKSRHLDVTHSMIRELIMNGVISIEFVRSQQNFADHLTMGLARDLVIKSAKGIGLKSN
ncbi:hypothetical protein Tco_0071131 [Tanacetum coccineum]